MSDGRKVTLLSLVGAAIVAAGILLAGVVVGHGTWHTAAATVVETATVQIAPPPSGLSGGSVRIGPAAIRKFAIEQGSAAASQTLVCVMEPQQIVYDPCEMSASEITGFFRTIQAASLYANWAKSNPGEVTRLKTWWADTTPYLGGTTTGIPVMKTAFGQALEEVVLVCKIVACPPTPWPVKAATSAVPDHTAPSAPTGLMVR